MRLASTWWVAAGVGALLLACSSAAPPPDFQTNEPQVRGGKTPAPPAAPAMTDGADAGSGGGGGACKTVPPNNKCGLDPQCGCETNETCDVTNTTTGATSCMTAGGGTLGRNCKTTGDCLAGFTCQYGACRPYCTSETDGASCTAPGTGICYTAIDDTTNKPIPNARVCTVGCDPKMPSAVCGNNSCIWFADLYAPAHVSDCNYPGSSDVLTGCALDSMNPKGSPNLTACKPGNACGLHPTYGYECERWCRVGTDADCADLKNKPTDPAGLFKCKDVYGAAGPVIGGVKEGLCQD